MAKTASKIRFTAKLLRPESTATGGSWTFLTLPKKASAKLPSRSMTSVEGTINDFPFRATLEPDGQKGHWLKVDRKLRRSAGAEGGDLITLEIAPVEKEPDPRCRQIYGKLSPRPGRRERGGPTSRPSHAEIGSAGSRSRSRQRRARARSRMPARCSLPGSDALAASIAPGSMIKASALLKRRVR
jgi:hypothetical protein